jgi:putative DNA primase/helicase
MQTYGEITIQKAIETSSFLSYQSAPTTNGHSNDPLPPLSVHSNLSSADFPQSDAGNAELFAALYGNRLRYDHRQRLWLKFAGHWWEHDRDEGVIRLALEAARYRQHLALQVQDADQKRRVMKWALEAESQGRLNAMLAIAKALPQFADSGENWDRDDWLLGVANGVVDLRTGAPRNGVPDDLITKHSPVSYDPNAQDDLWDEFRRATFVSPEVEQFVQTLAGIGACGSTIQRIGMAYGPTGTGKTTLMGGLQSVLGS